MDDKSKLKILMFFEMLRRKMDNLDDLNLPLRYSEEKGYLIAVEKMNFFINEFIDKEIDNDSSF